MKKLRFRLFSYIQWQILRTVYKWRKDSFREYERERQYDFKEKSIIYLLRLLIK